jgi:hypothetical protein
MPAMWLIIITGGLIWGGLEFYRVLERKYFDALAHVSAPVTTTGRAEPPAQEAKNPEKEYTASNEVTEPPRRAIIVREE